MFASVGRRLALLNALVVVAVIASIGMTTLLLLRQSLDREADQALAERAKAARTAWSEVFTTGQPLPSANWPAATAREDDEGEHDRGEEDDEDESHEVLESGDTLLFAVDSHGNLLANSRGVTLPNLPDAEGVREALAGTANTRGIRIGDESIRLYTMPVKADDQIVGAIQAARSDREHQEELRLVGLMTLAGIGLGTIVAVPAGLFLARRAMRPIDAAFARQRAFVADASHELRTPLTLMRATAELVQRLPDASPAVRDEVAAIISEIDDTNRLVDDLLLLARLDSSELPMQRQRVDLGALVRDAAAPMAPLAEAAGLALTVSAPVGVEVEVDPSRIRQVVRILLDNAIAYTLAGAVAVAVERQGSRARFTVRDTGPGIAPADQRQVFNRFYRADRARSRASGGAGLGLAIARALIEVHQGEIGLESQLGQGTLVWFTLPLCAAARPRGS